MLSMHLRSRTIAIMLVILFLALSLLVVLVGYGAHVWRSADNRGRATSTLAR